MLVDNKISRMVMMSVVQIVKQEAIFWQMSTKFCKIVSTFANFLISAARMVLPFGKLWKRFKSMPCMNAPNLVAIFAIMKISSIWREHNYFNISRENVQKSWFNVKFVAKISIGLILLSMNASKIITWRGLRLMNSKS